MSLVFSEGVSVKRLMDTCTSCNRKQRTTEELKKDVRSDGKESEPLVAGWKGKVVIEVKRSG
jgi:hypothetical protein